MSLIFLNIFGNFHCKSQSTFGACAELFKSFSQIVLISKLILVFSDFSFDELCKWAPEKHKISPGFIVTGIFLILLGKSSFNCGAEG